MSSAVWFNYLYVKRDSIFYSCKGTSSKFAKSRCNFLFSFHPILSAFRNPYNPCILYLLTFTIYHHKNQINVGK